MNKQVIVVDGHSAMRMAIKSLLEGDGFDVVAETDNGADALKLVERLTPAAMILEIDIPQLDGLSLMRNIMAKGIATKIVVYTGQQSDHLAGRCLQMGAFGFVCKQNEPYDLVRAVHAAMADKIYFTKLNHICLQPGINMGEHELLEKLSTRELRVMQQLVQGLSNKEIAQRMILSSKTISTYKSRILHKLNLSCLMDLYGFARRNGLN